MQVLSLKGELKVIQEKGIKIGSMAKLPNGDIVRITKIYRCILGSSHRFEVYVPTRKTNLKDVQIESLSF